MPRSQGCGCFVLREECRGSVIREREGGREGGRIGGGGGGGMQCQTS